LGTCRTSGCTELECNTTVHPHHFKTYVA
jgi:8-oxo-dGTP pyrophosphatase MutT (NUDIX family)